MSMKYEKRNVKLRKGQLEHYFVKNRLENTNGERIVLELWTEPGLCCLTVRVIQPMSEGIEEYSYTCHSVGEASQEKLIEWAIDEFMERGQK